MSTRPTRPGRTPLLEGEAAMAVPIATVVRARRNKQCWLVVVRCPHCRREHTHGVCGDGPSVEDRAGHCLHPNEGYQFLWEGAA